VPPETALGLLEAMKGWVDQYGGRMDVLWGFAGMPGGCGIVNVDTADELDEIMTAFPFAPFSETNIYALTDLKKSLARASETFNAMAASMSA
jgi:muconolactone delta-isomerase